MKITMKPIRCFVDFIRRCEHHPCSFSKTQEIHIKTEKQTQPNQGDFGSFPTNSSYKSIDWLSSPAYVQSHWNKLSLVTHREVEKFLLRYFRQL